MYTDEAAFKVCAAISEINGIITKKAAPILDELGRGYGAWMLQIIKDNFPAQQQVPVTDLDQKAGWKTIPGWSISSAIAALDLLEKKGLIGVDRHMEPWLIQARMSPEQAWKDIYSDMI